MAALPRTLKNMNVLVDGHSWAGVASKVNQPKIKKKTEGHRGAGMLGEVDLDMGYEKLEMDITYTGFDVRQYRQLSRCGTSDLPIRFVGAYERQDTCTTQHVEMYVRGQAVELDPGEAELGSKSETKMSYSLTYYRLEVDGVVEVELDFINGIERFGNTDLAQELKRILGL